MIRVRYGIEPVNQDLMNFHFLKSLLFIYVLSVTSVVFSQKIRGVYESMVYPPKDAPIKPSSNSEGVLEFPVKSTKTTIRFNWFHRLQYTVTNLDGSNPVVFKGKWSASGKIIHLKIRSADSLQLSNMEYVKLKSGDYVKWTNNTFDYFKKK